MGAWYKCGSSRIRRVNPRIRLFSASDCRSHRSARAWNSLASAQRTTRIGSAPRWLAGKDTIINRAGRLVCARNVTSAEQELLDDFAAGETERLLEQPGPLFERH